MRTLEELFRNNREWSEKIHRQDPEFFASMARSRGGRGRSVRGSATFLFGLVAFVFGAVLTQALPAWGVAVSVAGFLIMFCGVWLLCSGDRALRRHGQDAALRRRVGRFWDGMKDPPPPGISP